MLDVATEHWFFGVTPSASYGGDGETTFALPDLRDRAVMGFGHGPGLTDRFHGQSGGASSVSLTTSEIPAHQHGPIKAHDAPAVNGSPSFGNLAQASSNVYAPAENLVAMGDYSGGGQPHENRQPFLTVNFVIALQGIFPSRG